MPVIPLSAAPKAPRPLQHRKGRGEGSAHAAAAMLQARRLGSSDIAAPRAAPWRFADDALDTAMAPTANSVFELAAGGPGDHAALSGLAAALMASLKDRTGALVWVRTRVGTREQGALSGRGLAASGLDPTRLMVVAAKDDREALWATEEAVMSGAVAGVVTELGDADFTATRRLALRAKGTPSLLILPHGRQGATAAQARLRISAAPSAAHPDDPRAPGRPRWRAVLERCRNPRFSGAPQPFLLEWSDDKTLDGAGGAASGAASDAVRLRVVSQLAPAKAEARPPPDRNGRRFRRTG